MCLRPHTVRRCSPHVGAVVALLGVTMMPRVPAAQTTDGQPTAPLAAIDGLAGGWRVPLPQALGARASVVGSAGYAFTESVLRRSDVHHRGVATLAAGVQATRWLGFSLRFDGRLDSHESPSASPRTMLFGDVRLAVRAGGRLTDRVSLAGAVSVLLPGATAPSIVPEATTVSGLVFGAVRLPGDWLSVSAMFGARIDNSARVANTQPAFLGATARLSSEHSSYSALLTGLLVTAQRGRAIAYAEWSWDILLGPIAASASPMRVGAGARFLLSPAAPIALGVHVEASPSTRPAIDERSEIVPLFPLVSALATLSVNIGSHPHAMSPAPILSSTRPPTGPRPDSREQTPVAMSASRSARAAATVERLWGVVRDARGAPLGGAELTFRRGETPFRTVRANDDGRWAAEAIPHGDYEVRIESRTGAVRTVSIRVDTQSSAVEFDLRSNTAVAATESAALRGTVRSFQGAAILASVRVVELARTVRCDSNGGFELAVSPGTYTVDVSAAGYANQRRRVVVADGAVVILNTELRTRGGR